MCPPLFYPPKKDTVGMGVLDKPVPRTRSKSINEWTDFYCNTHNFCTFTTSYHRPAACQASILLNNGMTTEDRTQLQAIYEKLDFESSFDREFDPNIEKLKTEITAVCHALEHKLQGTISYYKHEKEEFFKNPRDMNHAEKLKNMLEHLKEPLYSYQEFRY